MSQRCGYGEDMGGVLQSLSIKTSAQADFKFSANRVCVWNLSDQKHSASYKK